MVQTTKRITAMIILIALFTATLFVAATSETNAKKQKYYSPKEIGMKKFNVNTGKNAVILKKIQRGKVIYSKCYRVSDENSTYLTSSKKEYKAKLTKKTKYYVGNPEKLNYGKKDFDHNSKWLKKVSKKKFVKKYKSAWDHSCWDRIKVKNGKVKAIATNCQWAE